MSDKKDTTDKEPAFALAVQYLKAMSFDNSGAPDSFRSSDNASPEDVSNDIKIDVRFEQVPDDGDYYEVQTLIEIISKGKGDSPRFTLRASYAAVVMARNIAEDDLMLLLNVETPRMTFPYLRAIISHATHESGYPALNLSPIDFMVVYKQRQEQEKDSK